MFFREQAVVSKGIMFYQCIVVRWPRKHAKLYLVPGLEYRCNKPTGTTVNINIRNSCDIKSDGYKWNSREERHEQETLLHIWRI